MDEQECQQDTVQRLQTWLNMLEERVVALLNDNDPESMKPAEREQAASRHLTMMLRLLQLRQQYAQPDSSGAEEALMDWILHGSDQV